MSRRGSKLVAVSVRGAGHIRRGRPNEDFVGAEPFEPDGWVIAVSDGHGAELHSRSNIGSRFAVEAALAEMRRINWQTDSVNSAAPLVNGLINAIIQLWRDKVEADLQHTPLDSAAAAASEAAGLGRVGPYGATLLAATARGAQMLVLQIGDGDFFIRGDDGSIIRPLPDDPREGEETASLCMITPERHARWRILPRPVAVLAATDGFSKSFADPSEAARAIAALLDRMADGEDDLQTDLSALSERGSSDDISLAAWLLDAEQGRPASHEAALPRPHLPWLRLILLAAAAAFAALIGIQFVGSAERNPEKPRGRPHLTEPTSTGSVKKPSGGAGDGQFDRERPK